MKNGIENGEPVVAEEATELARKTICIDGPVLRKGLARAKEEDRSFSNYVAWLIRRDGGGEQAPEVKEVVNG